MITKDIERPKRSTQMIVKTARARGSMYKWEMKTAALNEVFSTNDNGDCQEMRNFCMALYEHGSGRERNHPLRFIQKANLIIMPTTLC